MTIVVASTHTATPTMNTVFFAVAPKTTPPTIRTFRRHALLLLSPSHRRRRRRSPPNSSSPCFLPPPFVVPSSTTTLLVRFAAAAAAAAAVLGGGGGGVGVRGPLLPVAAKAYPDYRRYYYSSRGLGSCHHRRFAAPFGTTTMTMTTFSCGNGGGGGGGGGNGDNDDNQVRKRSDSGDSETSNLSAAAEADRKNNDPTRIHLPVLEYGYRTVPLEWEELRDIIGTGELAKLSRCVEDQKEYEIWKRDLKSHWKSVYDYLLCNKFGMEGCFERRTDAETGLYCAHPPLSEYAGGTRKALVANDFPYYTTKNVEHWVLWKLGGEPCDDGDIRQAEQDLRAKLGDVVDCLHWVNPPHLKSLPDIDHVHFLCLRRGESQAEEEK